MNDIAPSPQSVAAWKARADKIISMNAALGLAQAELEAKLKPIREAHEPEIEKLKAELKKLTAEFEDFGVQHADVLFADGSEIRTKIAVITGKVNPPSVEMGEGWTEAEVIDKLEGHKHTRGFVAVKKSLDKAALKKALSSGTVMICDLLLQCGVGLKQGFSVKVTGKGD